MLDHLGQPSFFRARFVQNEGQQSAACIFQEPPMSNIGVDNCRAEAEECRRLAAKAADAIEKDALQRMADDWLTRAQASPANAVSAKPNQSRRPPLRRPRAMNVSV
jgi:hypothetical protein